MQVCVQPEWVHWHHGGDLSTLPCPVTTEMSRAAIRASMAQTALHATGEGWAVGLGLRRAWRVHKVKEEAGEKAGGWVRTEAGWQTLSDPCAKLQ